MCCGQKCVLISELCMAGIFSDQYTSQFHIENVWNCYGQKWFGDNFKSAIVDSVLITVPNVSQLCKCE